MRYCKKCFKTISSEWSEFQDSLAVKIKHDEIRNRCFLERCVRCYVEYLLLVEDEEHKYYINMKNAIIK